MVKTVGWDEKIVKVEGMTLKRKQIGFELSFREIKHIRRCILFYLHIHPELNNEELDKNLSYKIHGKFKRFGKGDRRQNSSNIRKKMKDKPHVCSWDECKIDKNLIVDHIRPLSADGSNDKKNLRWLCKKHDRIRNIDYVLKRKIAEVKKLKKEREKLIEK